MFGRCFLTFALGASAMPAMDRSASAVVAPVSHLEEALTPEEEVEEVFNQIAGALGVGTVSPFFPYTNRTGVDLEFTLTDDYRSNRAGHVLVCTRQAAFWLSPGARPGFVLGPEEPVILAVQVLPGQPLPAKLFNVAKRGGTARFMWIQFEVGPGKAPFREWVVPPRPKRLEAVWSDEALGRQEREAPASLRGKDRWPEVRSGSRDAGQMGPG